MERDLPVQRSQRSDCMFFKGVALIEQGARPDPTRLPVILSIVTRVEFPINLANFSGELVSRVSTAP